MGGQFWLTLHDGEYAVNIQAKNYLPVTKTVVVSAGQSTPMVMKMTYNHQIAGIPRMIFIVLLGSLLLLVLTMVLCCSRRSASTWPPSLLKAARAMKKNSSPNKAISN